MAVMTGSSLDPEVAVLGAAAMDWVARVDELPQPDGIAWAGNCSSMPGGTGGNTAEALARLGIGVRFLGVLGDDDNGRRLLSAFLAAGVTCDAIRVQAGEASASTFIAVDRRGQRMIFSLGGAALYDRAEDIQPAWLEGIRALFIADAFPGAALAAIRYLEAGARVLFNPGGLMLQSGLPAIQPILESSHALIISRSEALALTGESNPEAAASELRKSGPETVILTLGEQGALILDQDKVVRVAAYVPGRVADTTGAGDVFSAGVVVGVREGWDWADSVRFGCAAAALKIGHFGARSGLPGFTQVQDFIEGSRIADSSEVRS